MNRKWFGFAVLAAIAVTLLNTSSCAHGQQLVAITIQPGSFSFLTPNPTLTANFTAWGTYLHPPENKDITTLVTWSSDIPQLVKVSGGVVSPTGNGCGTANISASYNHATGPSGNVVVGYAAATVHDPTVTTCP